MNSRFWLNSCETNFEFHSFYLKIQQSTKNVNFKIFILSWIIQCRYDGWVNKEFLINTVNQKIIFSRVNYYDFLYKNIVRARQGHLSYNIKCFRFYTFWKSQRFYYIENVYLSHRRNEGRRHCTATLTHVCIWDIKVKNGWNTNVFFNYCSRNSKKSP